MQSVDWPRQEPCRLYFHIAHTRLSTSPPLLHVLCLTLPTAYYAVHQTCTPHSGSLRRRARDSSSSTEGSRHSLPAWRPRLVRQTPRSGRRWNASTWRRPTQRITSPRATTQSRLHRRLSGGLSSNHRTCQREVGPRRSGSWERPMRLRRCEKRCRGMSLKLSRRRRTSF